MDANFGFCSPMKTATYKAGIYDWSAEFQPYSEMMNPSPPALFIIPGMNVGCFPYDALSITTLECFFSSACLNSTAQWISNLPASAWPKPLDISKLTMFRLNSTVASIIDEQMIDQWNNEVDFATYYKICAPAQCTHTFIGYENFFYIVTLLMGLLGSLNIALRIIAPLIIQLSRYLIQRFFKKTNQPNIPQDNMKQSMFQNWIDTFYFSFSIETNYLFSMQKYSCDWFFSFNCFNYRT